MRSLSKPVRGSPPKRRGVGKLKGFAEGRPKPRKGSDDMAALTLLNEEGSDVTPDADVTPVNVINIPVNTRMFASIKQHTCTCTLHVRVHVKMWGTC